MNTARRYVTSALVRGIVTGKYLSLVFHIYPVLIYTQATYLSSPIFVFIKTYFLSFYPSGWKLANVVFPVF